MWLLRYVVSMDAPFHDLIVQSYTNFQLQDVPAFHVAAGNPARIIRRIETTMKE